MNLKRSLPVIFFVLLALLTLVIKRCNNSTTNVQVKKERRAPSGQNTEPTATDPRQKLDRNTSELFFTKHAKCRMKCRRITQQEVRDILVNGTINYSKSELNDPKGPTYALEGRTMDRQKIRVIFAPKQKHMTVVTVIDLEEEHPCKC